MDKLTDEERKELLAVVDELIYDSRGFDSRKYYRKIRTLIETWQPKPWVSMVCIGDFLSEIHKEFPSPEDMADWLRSIGVEVVERGGEK